MDATIGVILIAVVIGLTILQDLSAKDIKTLREENAALRAELEKHKSVPPSYTVED